MNKKSIFKISVILVLLGSITFYACNKETVKQPNATTKKLALAKIDDGNPLDSLGTIHNNGLDYFIAHTRQRSSSSVPAITADFIDSLGQDTTGYIYTLAVVTSKTVSLTSTDDLDKYFTANKMSTEDDYYGKIKAIINDTTTTYDSVQSELGSLLVTIQGDKTLPSSSITLFEAGIAVYSHSAEYWYGQIALGEKSPWYNGTPMPAFRWRLWMSVDAGYALWGVICAGPWGALFGVACSALSAL
ncbi:MAG: hypothetical protein P4L41_06490 [Flavipsychrobacter sp.]|nr:hypothetical protein [Flavipsychrobacter sp.]